MAGLRVRVPGSSMIEAIVASAIFLLVFAVSLSTLTGLAIRDDETYELLEAERAMTDCFLRYGSGTMANGSYTDQFEWGEITTAIENYGDYEDIRQVSMRAVISGSRKSIVYTRLVTVRRE